MVALILVNGSLSGGTRVNIKMGLNSLCSVSTCIRHYFGGLSYWNCVSFDILRREGLGVNTLVHCDILSSIITKCKMGSVFHVS